MKRQHKNIDNLINQQKIGRSMKTEKISTGSEDFDLFLGGGYESGIVTTLYGPAGSGKTNFCIMLSASLAKKGKKVIYIDTEGGFSFDRLNQIDTNCSKYLDKIFFLKPTNFEEQGQSFEKLRGIIESFKDKPEFPIGAIIIDTISMLYRIALGQANDVYNINKELGAQVSYLTEIARKKNIPIIITNQVYSDFERKDEVKLVGGDILKYGSKAMIELKNFKNARGAIIIKHRSISENSKFLFKIVDSGIEYVSK